MTKIQVGDDVVCIDAKIFDLQYIDVKEGEAYRVRWVGPCSSYMNGDYFGIRLEGIYRGICPEFGDEDPPFRAERFRVVQMPKQKENVREIELT